MAAVELENKRTHVMIHTKRIFHGWVIVISGTLMLALALGMYVSTNSLFVKPVCESFGFSRGQFTFYRTIIALTGALVMLIYGGLIQKTGVKKVLLMGALMLGFISIGYSFCTRLWHFYILALINGLFLNSISFMSVGILVNTWFTGKKGLATGLAYAGSGLGGAVMIPIVGHFIEAIGWQWAYRFMGIFGISILLPVIVIFIKNTPNEMGLEPLPPDKSGQKTDSVEIHNCSFHEAFRTLNFWLLVIAFFFINFFAAAANTHSAPYLSDLGYAAPFVSYVIALFMFFMTVGKIILGFVYDRFGAFTGNVIVCFFCLGFPIFALLAYMPAIPLVYAVFIGMASCGVSIPMPILITRYFGNKDFPGILSFYMMISSLAQSVSVPAMGVVYDLTGSYAPAWSLFLVCSVIITGCLISVEILNRGGKK